MNVLIAENVFFQDSKETFLLLNHLGSFAEKFCTFGCSMSGGHGKIAILGRISTTLVIYGFEYLSKNYFHNIFLFCLLRTFSIICARLEFRTTS